MPRSGEESTPDRHLDVEGGDCATMESMAVGTERDFYETTRWAWHALFAVVVALSGAFLVADNATVWIALLAVLVGAYVAAFARIVQNCATEARGARSSRLVALAYLAVAYGVVAVLAWVDPNTLVLLFILFPQTFLALELTGAVVASVLLNALYTLVLLTRSGWSAQALRTEGLGGVMTTVFAVAMGAFISGLVRQGEQRRKLIAELTAARTERDEARWAADVAAERGRLGREVHDTLAQEFMSVVMLAQAARAALSAGDGGSAGRRLDQIDSSARAGLAEARALVATMQPKALDGQTLDHALERLVNRFQAETGVRTRFRAERTAAAAHSPNEDVVLLRSAQEALANVRRHAGATEVEVRLLCEEMSATLTVVDDGRGFDPAVPSGGYGLAGMRARAAEVGGRVEVDSTPGGTIVRVQVGGGVSGGSGVAGEQTEPTSA